MSLPKKCLYILFLLCMSQVRVFWWVFMSGNCCGGGLVEADSICLPRPAVVSRALWSFCSVNTQIMTPSLRGAESEKPKLQPKGKRGPYMTSALKGGGVPKKADTEIG